MSKTEAATPKEAASWDDKVADALPKKATFFNAIRTNAFTNHNMVQNYVEYWAAFQVDEAEDKWRVMHYSIFDLDQEDGKFVSEAVTKTDVTFPEAVFQLARAEYTSSKMTLTQVSFDMETKYPPHQYPELKTHFYDLEHYKPAANIEGIAFDEYNQPYRKVQGKIFADATFKRGEIVKSILGVEQARNNEKVRERIEGGLLSDIFNTAVQPAATLDDKLKIGQVLSLMDNFAVQIAAFYIAIQKAVGVEAGLEKIGWLKPDDREDIMTRAKASLGGFVSGENAYKVATKVVLPQANALLSQVEALGVHVEPFRKFTAECDLYANLVQAAKNVARLDKAMMGANNSDIGLITEIREAVNRAQDTFLSLGGTHEKMDRLKAWVAAHAREEKDPVKAKELKESMIPAWLPGFLTRYYDRRSDIMVKVRERNAGLRQVNVMPADVKPPVTDAFNENRVPEPKPQEQQSPATSATAPAQGESDESEETFAKYRNFGEGASKKSPKL